MKDHYRTLGIPENATEQDIKLAYRRLAKRYHPDVNAGDKHAEERFKEIVAAYDVLSDPVLKRTYDVKRMRNELYSGNIPFYSSEPKAEKKDPRRKEYSEEDLNRARAQHKKRVAAQMERRKKLLKGMIITFILYLCASAGFEYWTEQKRKKESEEIARDMLLMQQKEQQLKKTTIDDMDSPYDNLFGEGKYADLSPDNLVIYNPLSDAVICAVENNPPFRTIRNEFVHAKTSFVMRGLPDGSYFLKVYTGENWNVNKRIPDGRSLGGFTRNEEFFKVDKGPFTLEKPTYKHTDAHYCDTIVIDPTFSKLDPISREDFFNPGKR